MSCHIVLIKKRFPDGLADFFAIEVFQAIPPDFADHYKQLSLWVLYRESGGPILFQAGA